MTRFKRFSLFLIISALLASCAPALTPPLATPTTAALSAIGREHLKIDFGDFQTRAELTYPADAVGGRPTIILIHGSAPADMDYTLYSIGAKPELLSHNFRNIAEYLTPRGYSVLRYNKHYVTSASQVDFQSYNANIDLHQLLADVEKVLAAARANPHVDAGQIFVYGFSEGSVVGAALAVRHPEIAGLIVQGPVALPYRESLAGQIRNVCLPYLRSFASDGRVTSVTLEQALNGPGGRTAKWFLLDLLDPTYSQTGKIAVNPDFDLNHDGILSLDEELLPALDRWLDAIFAHGRFRIYAPGQALPTMTEQASNLELPVLILQGENDANTPLKGAQLLDQALATAGNPDHQLKVYAGLGHSLGPAANLIDDNSRPIAQGPLADSVAWLVAHSK